MDGSQKLPQRLLNTVRDNLAANRPIARLALSVAGWMRYVHGTDERGRAVEVADPLERLQQRILDHVVGVDQIADLGGKTSVGPSSKRPRVSGEQEV